MESHRLLNFFGHSIKHENLRNLLIELNFDLNSLKSMTDWQGHIYDAEIKHQHENVFLKFQGYQRYKWEYGEAKNIENKNLDELIFIQIYFSYNPQNVQNYMYLSLPFELKFEQKRRSILQKLKLDSKKTYRGKMRRYNTFIENDYIIYLYFNKKSELDSICITKLNCTEVTKNKMEAELHLQKDNLKLENIPKLTEYKNKLPTKDLKRRIENGGTIHSMKDIEILEWIFLDFIEALIKFTLIKDPVKIYSSIKEVVFNLNRAKSEFKVLIETDEREEFCEAIDNMVACTGFKIYDNIDLTEEWREW